MEDLCFDFYTLGIGILLLKINLNDENLFGEIFCTEIYITICYVQRKAYWSKF